VFVYKVIGADGQQYGPISAEQLRQWIAEGRAVPQTLVQAEGSADWKPLASFPEFHVSPPPAAPPVTAGGSGQRVEGADKKIVAGLCGILIGALGIHKFVLGYSGEGVVMLLISIVGGILTCGLATTAMSIVGLVEGIIYITKSDEEFVRTYVHSKKGWF
jgi:TM2 domain-containing membrane protein YozV